MQVFFENDLKILAEERKKRCQYLSNGKLYYIEVELKKKEAAKCRLHALLAISHVPGGYSDELRGKAVYTLCEMH
ncbi:MAG: hypothetical protein D3908_16595 [Candidatus Electrothrix sp. AUS4]|nr:hypothetical protein [Candidatus Electrothrix sp. AUS4]